VDGCIGAPEEKKFCGAPKVGEASAPEEKNVSGAPKEAKISAPEEKSSVVHQKWVNPVH